VDFCGFVVFADGRIRVRTSVARRFQKRAIPVFYKSWEIPFRSFGAGFFFL